jgi:hypothetical protein
MDLSRPALGFLWLCLLVAYAATSGCRWPIRCDAVSGEIFKAETKSGNSPNVCVLKFVLARQKELDLCLGADHCRRFSVLMLAQPETLGAFAFTVGIVFREDWCRSFVRLLFPLRMAIWDFLGSAIFKTLSSKSSALPRICFSQLYQTLGKTGITLRICVP